MTKLPRKPTQPSEREFKVILEDIQSQFRVFGEGLEGVNHRLDRVDQRLDKVDQRFDRLEGDVTELKSDMTTVKIILRTVATKDDLLVIDRRLTALETRQ